MRTHSTGADLSASGGSEPGARVRALAARVNAATVSGGESLDRALVTADELADPRDAALLRAIAYGTLRWHHRLQWQVEQLASRPLKRRDAALAALLRVGLFQLQWLRIPDHAAVAATVDAARLLGAGRARGLVNAILRRFLREREALDGVMRAHREAAASHPRWLLELLDRDWPGRAAEIVEANNRPPPMWLRVNVRRSSPEAYRRRLDEHGIEVASVDAATGAIALDAPRPAESLPGYEQGLVSVQDAAAQLAAGLLAPEAGDRVLDACAAPGGKAAHLLETHPGIGALVALDRDAGRLRLVADNFRRLGLGGEARVGDALEPAAWWDGGPFERILLDGPCSALGVIRRHPDIKLLRRPEDIASMASRQARMLRALWPLLAPGGRLLYATCTIAKRENGAVIEDFLASASDAELGPTGAARTLQILPGETNRDGFYYACLHKR